MASAFVTCHSCWGGAFQWHSCFWATHPCVDNSSKLIGSPRLTWVEFFLWFVVGCLTMCLLFPHISKEQSVSQSHNTSKLMTLNQGQFCSPQDIQWWRHFLVVTTSEEVYYGLLREKASVVAALSQWLSTPMRSTVLRLWKCLRQSVLYWSPCAPRS